MSVSYNHSVIDFGVLPPTPGMLQGGVYQQPERAEAFARTCGFEPPLGLRSKSLTSLLEDMDAGKVEVAVIRGRQQVSALDGAVVAQPFEPSSLSANEATDVMNCYPGRFLAYAGISEDMLMDPAGKLDPILADKRFRGLMLSAGYFETPMYANDPKLFELYDYSVSRGLPMMINFGGNSGPDISFTDPRIMDDIARHFPSLEIVVHHGGWPWVNEILHIAFRRSNVHLAPDQHIHGFPGWRDYVEAGNGFLQDRLLFSSYFPFLPVAKSAERFGELFHENVRSKVLYDNASRLLQVNR